MTPIELVDCTEFINDERWAVFLGDSEVKYRIDIGDELLCPNSDSMTIQGKFGDKHFSYVEIGL